MSAISSIGSMPASPTSASISAQAPNGNAGASLGDLHASGTASSHSASSVMINSQASTFLSSFQTALEGQDTLKMMMAMLILEALGGNKDKDEKDSSMAALALLGAAAGSQAGGAFMASYASISQLDSQTVSSMNQQLHTSAGYTAPTTPATGGMVNVMG